MVNSTASQQQVTMRDINKPKSCTAGICSQETMRTGHGEVWVSLCPETNQKAGSLQTEVGTVYRTSALGLGDTRSCAGHSS